MRPVTRYVAVVLVVLALVAAFFTWRHGQVAAEERPEVGYAAPNFTLVGLDGKEVRLADLKGKPVFLNFWATWCPPCREEMPAIQKLFTIYGKDVAFLTVNMTVTERSTKNIEDFLRQNGYTLPVVLDKSGDVATKYLVRAIPTSFFVDRKGIIREKVVGSMNEETMREYLKEILR